MNRPDELERTVRGAATAAALPSLLVLLIIIALPKWSLQLVFGEAYVGAAAALLMLALGQIVLVLSGNPQHVLTMTGRHRAVFVINLLSSAILIGGGVLGARQFGAAGLAGASAASLAFQNGAMWWIVRRELGINTHVSFETIFEMARGRRRGPSLNIDSTPPDALASVTAASVHLRRIT
jgi:O-antigen/teichoic acid export membrane protein